MVIVLELRLNGIARVLQMFRYVFLIREAGNWRINDARAEFVTREKSGRSQLSRMVFVCLGSQILLVFTFL